MTGDFIQRIASAASQDMQCFGILASVTMAQAILESGWGTSELAKHANALFGIKADKRWSGRTYEIKTKEWYDGNEPVIIVDKFRAYSTWKASIADHTAFLTASPRYRYVIGEQDYKKACKALQAAGYSTDPDYANKLIRLIEKYNLTQYDKKDTRMKKTCNPANYTQKNRAETKYIVVHYTSNKGDTAKNNADYFAREKVGASAHFFVDEKEIWESVPESAIAWHCGAKTYRHSECRNANSIGVEICMHDRAGKIRQGSIDHAARLVRELMQRYRIPPERVLRHYDVTGKYCPGPMVDDPALWQAFKNKLTGVEAEQEESMKIYKHTTEMPEWAQGTFRRLIDAGIVKVDEKGEIAVQESSIQPMVYLDRLCGGKIEKLPELVNQLAGDK